MEVYIDSLFLINLFMDTVILFIVSLLVCADVSGKRIFLGAALSAVYGAVMVFPRLAFLYGAVFKLIMSGILVFAAFGRCGVRRFLRIWAVFWLVSAVAGGIIFAMSVFTDFGAVMQTSAVNCVLYMNISPLLLAVGCAALYVLIEVYRRMCIRNFSRERIILKLNVRYLGKDYSLKGLIDTGCELTEPLSGAPVIIADKRIFCGIPEPGYRLCADTVSGRNSLDYIIPDRIDSADDGIKIEAGTIVALSEIRLSNNGIYNALINPIAVNDAVCGGKKCRTENTLYLHERIDC